jgi:hypothetical protein
MARGMSETPELTRSTDEHTMGRGVLASGAGSRRRSERPRPSPHAHRFRLATAILVGCAVGAIVIAVAIAGTDHRSRTAAKWSSWVPPDGGTAGAREIADYLAPFYRATPADQLAVVTVVNLESASALAAAQAAAANGTTPTASSALQVAVRPKAGSSQVSLLTGNTVAYNLCGVGGKNCAIGAGTPSNSRLLLLRREALELALYTFKYIHGTQNVLTILPPVTQTPTSKLSRRLPTTNASTKPINVAVLFVRPMVQPLLAHPLTASLPEPVTLTPTPANMSNAPEAGLVDQLTARWLFSEQLQQAQDGSNLIVLDRLPPQ